MMVYFDTVKRKRPVRQGGDLVKLDWDSKRVVRTVPVFPYDPDIEIDPNPRGNSRGGKGMRISGEELIVGSYHSLSFYDLDLNLRRKISNPLFVNIHEICLVRDLVWVSSTAIDAAVLVDRQGRTVRSWWPREQPLLQDSLALFPMAIDKTADNRLRFLGEELSKKEGHTHLNSVFCHGDRVYVLLNRFGAIVQIEPELRIVLIDPILCGAHSPALTRDGTRLCLCNTKVRQLVIYDLETKTCLRQIPLLDFPELARLQRLYPDQPFSKSLFLRGLEFIDEDRVLVGLSPAAIAEIDVNTNKLIDLFQFSQDVGDAVHGLVCHRSAPAEPGRQW